MATRKPTDGAFGKPTYRRLYERPTWEWVSADGNTIIQYFDGMVPPDDTPDLSALAGCATWTEQLMRGNRYDDR